MKRHLRSATALAALTFSSQFVAFADPDAADSDRRLETVTVTTQKQEQTLIDVPINVSVTDQDLIDKLAADDIEDLGNFVPAGSGTEPQRAELLAARGRFRQRHAARCPVPERRRHW